jgi:hypothetical protein
MHQIVGGAGVEPHQHTDQKSSDVREAGAACCQSARVECFKTGQVSMLVSRVWASYRLLSCPLHRSLSAPRFSG